MDKLEKDGDDTEHLEVTSTELIPILIAGSQAPTQRIETLETLLQTTYITKMLNQNFLLYHADICSL